MGLGPPAGCQTGRRLCALLGWSHHGLGNLVASFTLCSAQGCPAKARWQGCCPRAAQVGPEACWGSAAAGAPGGQGPAGCESAGVWGCSCFFLLDPRAALRVKALARMVGNIWSNAPFPGGSVLPMHPREASAGHGHPVLPTGRAFLPPNRITGRGEPDNQICRGEPRAASAAE